MIKLSNFFRNLFLLMIFFSPLIYQGQLKAQVDRGGNGGCSECQISYELGLKVVNEFKKIPNNEIINNIDSIYSGEFLIDLYQMAYYKKVMPSDQNKYKLTNENLTAESRKIDNINVTILNLEKYPKLNLAEKEAIEIHELLILMGIESEGYYYWSNQLKTLLSSSYNQILNKFEKGKFIKKYYIDENSRLITIYNPLVQFTYRIYHFGTHDESFNLNVLTTFKTNLDGVCKYFHLKKYEAKTMETHQIIDWLSVSSFDGYKIREVYGHYIDENGILSKLNHGDKDYSGNTFSIKNMTVITKIKCSY